MKFKKGDKIKVRPNSHFVSKGWATPGTIYEVYSIAEHSFWYKHENGAIYISTSSEFFKISTNGNLKENLDFWEQFAE